MSSEADRAATAQWVAAQDFDEYTDAGDRPCCRCPREAAGVTVRMITYELLFGNECVLTHTVQEGAWIPFSRPNYGIDYPGWPYGYWWRQTCNWEATVHRFQALP